MARIRTVKPELFRHELLFEAERKTRLPLRIAFVGLLTVADREGRFRWQPRVLKLDVLPFDDLDFGKVLDALCEYGFIVKYQVGSEQYAHIPSWRKHQQINSRESESAIPAPDEACASTCMHMPEPVQVEGEGEGKGREGKRKGVEARASRFALDSLPADWEDFCRQERQDLDPFGVFDRFRDYWRSVPGAKGRKLDWLATWRNWVRNERADRPRARQSPEEVAAEAMRMMEQRDAQAGTA